MDDRAPMGSPGFRRALLRLVPPPEPTELTKMARKDPELLDFLRFLVVHDLREEALELLRGRKTTRDS